MKKSKVNFLFSFLCFAAFSAELAWNWKNPLPAGYHLTSVTTLNETAAIAVGEHGIILKTADNIHWEIISSEINHYYYSAFFTDSLKGWILGSTSSENEAVILRTADGGSTWEKYLIAGIDSYNDIFFVNTNTGYFSSNTQIFKTIDGGKQWQKLYSDTNHTFHTLFFLNPDTGWASGAPGTILKTTDGGSTWTPYETPDDLNNILDICFSNADTGWAVGGLPLLIGYARVILKTVDGGASWKILSDAGTGIYESVYFTDRYTGWVCTHLGSIIKTTDGGADWEAQVVFKNGDLTALHFADNLNGHCVGFNGRILKTTDGGKNWVYISKGEMPFASQFTAMQFTGDTIGWAGGYWHEPSISGPMLYTTNDAGNHWKPVYVPIAYTHFTVSDIFFFSQQHGRLLLSNDTASVLLTTDNGCAVWEEDTISSATSFTGSALFFITPDTGYIAGKESYACGKLLHTANGGSTWHSVSVDSIDTIPPLNDIVFVDKQNGWAAGNNGTIIHTGNGGISWQMQNSTVNNDLTTMYFLNDSTGWVCGYNKILATTDSGTTWSNISPRVPGRFSFTSLYFTATDTGWAATGTDTLLFTANGGNSWKKCPIGIGREITLIYSLDGNNIWTAGNYATILHTYYEGSIAVKDKVPSVSQSGIAVNLYPHPVSKKAFFSFSLQTFSEVSLSVFTLSGKCVATVINRQKMAPGQKCFSWDRRDKQGNLVSSGMYIYALTINSSVIIKRFVIF